jgi:hypothetical protein
MQILNALEYVHSKGIIHGEVKPGNIVLSPKRIVKLVAFGLATTMRAGLEVAPSGFITETPDYMSPEQVQGHRLDRQTDVYSTGVLAYELFSGRRAFTGNAAIVMQKVLSEQPPPMEPALINGFVEVERIVSRAIAKSREDRYKTADEMRKELALFLTSSGMDVAQVRAQMNAVAAHAVSEARAFLTAGRVTESEELLSATLRDNPIADEAQALLVALASTPRDAHPPLDEQRTPAQASPALIGRYRIESNIGRGGMGGVYTAFDPLLQRVVVLKTFNVGPTVDTLPTDALRRVDLLSDSTSAHDSGSFGARSPDTVHVTAPAPSAALPAEPRGSPKIDENVQFTVYAPSKVRPTRWYSLLAFAHLAERRTDSDSAEPDPIAEVQRQARQVLGEQASEFKSMTQDSRLEVPREGQLTFVPQVAGVEFNPPSRHFSWTEMVHREEFRFCAETNMNSRVARGALRVYLGTLILAEVNLTIRVDSHGRESDLAPEVSQARPYRYIFASYSRLDLGVVEEFETYARGLGDRYLRDLITLRTGEIWSDRLRELIDRADVFQLFWSWNALRSQFVRSELEHALSLKRPHFIRPVYWESPFPERPGLPPDELRRLHFERVLVKVGAETSAVKVDPISPVAMTAPAASIETTQVTADTPKTLPRQKAARSQPLIWVSLIAVLLALLLIALFLSR